MNNDMKQQISELTDAIDQKRHAIESMSDNLKYADNIAYTRDREKIKDSRVLLRVMLDELDELKLKAGISFTPEKKAHTVKLFVYEKLKPYHPDNRFTFSTGEFDQNFTDFNEMVFVGTTEFTAMLNTIDGEQEFKAMCHRDEMRMRFALEEMAKNRDYTGPRLHKKAS